MQQAWGSCWLPKGQIGLNVAVAECPSDLLTPFSGCWLPVGWCVVTEEEESEPGREACLARAWLKAQT